MTMPNKVTYRVNESLDTTGLVLRQITNRQNAEQWKADGQIPLEKAANAKWKQMLEDYVEPSLPADVEEEKNRLDKGFMRESVEMLKKALCS